METLFITSETFYRKSFLLGPLSFLQFHFAIITYICFGHSGHLKNPVRAVFQNCYTFLLTL